MSQLATCTIVPMSRLAEVLAVARPAPDALDGTLKKIGRELRPYDGQGGVLATLLPYLEENGIDLGSEDPEGVATQLSDARGSSFIALTTRHRDAHADVLVASRFKTTDLQQYYEEFTDSRVPGAGVAMAKAIDYLGAALRALKDGEVALVEIG
jgi:hypothetical protein